jgi:hypothetical protein
MDNELEMMWTEAVVAKFLVLSRYLPAETQEYHKNLSYRWPAGRNLNMKPTKYETGVLTTRLQRSVIAG